MEILSSSPYLSCFLVTIVGLFFGSFSTMAAYRMPRGLDVIWRASHCTVCHHRLGVLDLFPVISWLFSGGKCRYCKTPIPCRYLLIELATAALFVFIYTLVGWQWSMLIPLWILVTALVIMVVVDFEHQIIPDTIHVVLIPMGLWYRHTNFAQLEEAFIGGIVGVAVALALRYGFWLWKKKEGLGLGDVKFFAVVGVFIQPELFAVFMFISGMTGIVISLLWRFLGKGEAFPFGPALGVSMLLCVLFPEALNIIGY